MHVSPRCLQGVGGGKHATANAEGMRGFRLAIGCSNRDNDRFVFTMDCRISKRSYTDPALEFWFSRMDGDWEQRFTADELSLGRKIYREGGVRELALSETDAIATIRWQGKDAYVVLDYPASGLQYRASTGDHGQARVMAVAGLYEIEELVGDEIPALPGIGNGGDTAKNNQDTPPAQQHPSVPPIELHLKFKLEPKGLSFSVWAAKDVAGRKVRLLENSETGAEPAVRESLIRLMAMAKRCEFHFRKGRSDFVLENLERLPLFVCKDMPHWREYFNMDSDGCLDVLAKGTRELTLHTEARDNGNHGLDLNWALDTGSELLDRHEAGRVLRQQGHTLLLPRHGLVRLNPDAARFFNELQDHPDYRKGAPLPRYMLFSLFAQNGAHTRITPELANWKKSLSRAPSTAGENKYPGAPLRSYQMFGVNWMHHLSSHHCHGLLADEMGLGKTLQMLAYLAGTANSGRPALVVCPASVVPVWFAESRRFFPDMRLRAAGKHALPGYSDVDQPDVWICSYTQLRRNRSVFEKIHFSSVILDEAQFIKNPDAKVTQACLSLTADHRFALTGTPLENRYLDIWTIFRFLMPGLLGSRRRFQQRLQDDPGQFADALKSQIAPFVLRRTKAAVARELPDKMESELVCPLSELQSREYQRLVEDGRRRLDGNIQITLQTKAMGLLTLLTRLRQTCCDPDLLPWMNAPLEQSGKIEVLKSRLGEILAAGHKAVVFSQYVSLLKRVRLMLDESIPNTPVFELTGQSIDRVTPVNTFQKQRGAAVFLASLKAGGSGITLHAADYVFLLDPWWNPAVEAQAIDRVHRIGQNKPVFVYRMITRGTIEEKIRRMQTHKQALSEHLFTRVGHDLSAHFKDLEALIALTE